MGTLQTSMLLGHFTQLSSLIVKLRISTKVDFDKIPDYSKFIVVQPAVQGTDHVKIATLQPMQKMGYRGNYLVFYPDCSDSPGHGPMAVAVGAMEQGVGMRIVDDLFFCRIEIQCPADTAGDIRQMAERG